MKILILVMMLSGEAAHYGERLNNPVVVVHSPEEAAIELFNTQKSVNGLMGFVTGRLYVIDTSNLGIKELDIPTIKFEGKKTP